jgi:hypothetical protein
MENRIEKYQEVQAEIIRLTSILMTQYWLDYDQSWQEATRIESRVRRERTRCQIDNDWYLWVQTVEISRRSKPTI